MYVLFPKLYRVDVSVEPLGLDWGVTINTIPVRVAKFL